MPVLPEVGSISTVSALITPAFSIAITIAAPMRSFTLAAGLKYSSLARMVALTLRLRQPEQADDRGIADRVDDGVKDLSSPGALHCTH
jgi:hypothetical protein